MSSDRNEIVKKKVSKLGKRHRRLYGLFADYYRELNTAPMIEDMVLEMGASSKEEVYKILSDLIAAGCLTAWDSRGYMRPMLSPDEAAMWCDDNQESVNERICLIERAVTSFYFHEEGKLPQFNDFMKAYRDSSLYLLIREEAEPYFNTFVDELKNGNYVMDKDAVVTAAWT